MNNKYLIVFLTFLFFITVGFIIYLNSSSDIPVVYGSSDPIRELPSNAPQMDRPPNIPCIYSLWKNPNESCGPSENVFEEKKPTSGYFSLIFGTFLNSEDANIHTKKLKAQKFLQKIIIKTIEIPATSKVIQVEKGDTLSRIAKRHSLKVKRIIDDNNIANPNNIKVGQSLMIPGEPLKYRIITRNIEERDTAQNFCNKLLNSSFSCQIVKQR